MDGNLLLVQCIVTARRGLHRVSPTGAANVSSWAPRKNDWIDLARGESRAMMEMLSELLALCIVDNTDQVHDTDGVDESRRNSEMLREQDCNQWKQNAVRRRSAQVQMQAKKRSPTLI